MIVAIINQTVPVGTVPVSQFRDAANVVDAVTAYVNSFNPPLNPLDWLGFDTGWVAYTPPPSGMGYRWSYDFGSLTLVETLLPETDRLALVTSGQILNGPLQDLSGGTTPFAWQDMGFLSVNMDFLFQNIAQAQFRVWGQYQCAQVGVNTAQVRLSAGGVAYTNVVDLPDTGGAWVNFSLDTIGFVLPGGRRLFVVQTLLRNAGTVLSLRGVDLAMFKTL